MSFYFIKKACILMLPIATHSDFHIGELAEILRCITKVEDWKKVSILLNYN